MPTIDEVLKTRTFEDQCPGEGVGDAENVRRRVFYTLTQDKAQQAHRNSQLLALVVDHLCRTSALSPEQLNELLLELV